MVSTGGGSEGASGGDSTLGGPAIGSGWSVGPSYFDTSFEPTHGLDLSSVTRVHRGLRGDLLDRFGLCEEFYQPLTAPPQLPGLVPFAGRRWYGGEGGFVVAPVADDPLVQGEAAWFEIVEDPQAAIGPAKIIPDRVRAPVVKVKKKPWSVGDAWIVYMLEATGSSVLEAADPSVAALPEFNDIQGILKEQLVSAAMGTVRVVPLGSADRWRHYFSVVAPHSVGPSALEFATDAFRPWTLRLLA